MIAIQHNRMIQQRGLSLVELMVALTLGVFLTFGVIQAFLSGKQAYGMQQALARIQENARLAQEFIGNDIRGAGDYGCASGDDFLPFGSSIRASDLDPKNLCSSGSGLAGGTVGINMLTASNALTDYSSAVYAFDNVTGATVYGYTLSPTPIAGTDVLLVRTAMEVGRLRTSQSGVLSAGIPLTEALQTISYNNGNALVSGEVVAISDCAKTKIMMVDGTTAVNSGNTTFGVSTNAANNYCTNIPVVSSAFQSSYDSTNGPYAPQISQTFVDGATVRKLVDTYYYVAADPTNNNVPTLYRQRVVNVLTPTSAANPAAEALLEGVQDMQVQLGVESSNKTTGNTMVPANYMDPSAVTGAMWSSWDTGYCTPVDAAAPFTCYKTSDANHDMYQTVRSVRYSLLLTDYSQQVLGAGTTGGTVAGRTSQTYTFPGWSTTLTTANDGYLRQVIVNTVGLRTRVNMP